MNALDNIERRDSGPAHLDKTAAGNDDAAIYTDLVTAACKAIRAMPISMVTGEYIAQILATLSCKATEAGMDRESDVLGACYIEVQ